MPRSLIALGSNLGDRALTLRRAVELISADRSISNTSASGFHETPPVGGPPGQGPFLNAAVAFDTTLAPEELHELLRRIETQLGRRPAERWAARSIDIDLLLFGQRVIDTDVLSVPHPRMAFRRFVLAPAAEVAREMVHPLIGWTVGRLLAHLDAAAPYVALLAMPADDRATLARRVAGAVGGTYLALPAGLALGEARTDPSGHAERRQIQFLDRAANLLAGHDWHQAQGVAISDFYFDEPLAHARIDCDEPGYDRVRAAWAAHRDRVAAPKLLVVLDTPAEGLRARTDPTREPPDAGPAERLRRELLGLANCSHQGPTLYAGRDDAQFQFDEITAAIAAMA